MALILLCCCANLINATETEIIKGYGKFLVGDVYIETGSVRPSSVTVTNTKEGAKKTIEICDLEWNTLQRVKPGESTIVKEADLHKGHELEGVKVRVP